MRGKEDPNSIIASPQSFTPHFSRFTGSENPHMLALNNVSFEVKRGEVLGIIGKNGAGKSTLLKILSEVTSPTKGQVKIKGRVASLLEVGTGFHPELTGRENIYLNGAILGMSKQEIAYKFDEIVAFAEVEKFIDTPVKRYSSGMYVRLAFSVAAHLEPEILIIDEVLAVGDASFQKKCLGKMGDVSKEGRTVLFVSHNMAAVQNLCSECIWIKEGTIHLKSGPSEVIYNYLSNFGIKDFSGEMDLRNWPNRRGNGEARIVHACLRDENAVITTVVHRTHQMTVEFIVESNSHHVLHFSATAIADAGLRILHLSHHDTPGLNLGVLHGRYLVQLTIPSLPLCAGNYSWVLAVHTDNLFPVDVVNDVLPFIAEDTNDSPRPYKTIAEYAYCWTANNWSISPIHSENGIRP